MKDHITQYLFGNYNNNILYNLLSFHLAAHYDRLDQLDDKLSGIDKYNKLIDIIGEQHHLTGLYKRVQDIYNKYLETKRLESTLDMELDKFMNVLKNECPKFQPPCNKFTMSLRSPDGSSIFKITNKHDLVNSSLFQTPAAFMVFDMKDYNHKSLFIHNVLKLFIINYNENVNIIAPSTTKVITIEDGDMYELDVHRHDIAAKMSLHTNLKHDDLKKENFLISIDNHGKYLHKANGKIRYIHKEKKGVNKEVKEFTNEQDGLLYLISKSNGNKIPMLNRVY